MDDKKSHNRVLDDLPKEDVPEMQALLDAQLDAWLMDDDSDGAAG